MDIMPLEQLPDFEKRLQRQDAFWAGAIIDRPVVSFQLAKKKPLVREPPPRQWKSLRERWLDADYHAEKFRALALNTDFFGDALPAANPNLGPELFSAFFGLRMEYGETTSWAVPNLSSWDKVDQLQFDTDNFYWKALERMTDVFLEAGQHVFYTGMTDLHPGGDAIAAFRDPMQLNIDMIEHRDEVKSLLRKVAEVYFFVCRYFFEKLGAAGQAVTAWPGICSRQKWYVPGNDFSCMISKEMFDDVFLSDIIQECRFLEASIYHLDGPGALHHLDSLLDIKELNAIQWVFGAGNGRASDWLHVYRRCQDAGKGVQIFLHADELDLFMSALRPEGIWLSLSGVRDHEHGDHLLRQIAKWR